ncbi:MAG: polysaccharide biosynthesis C-terminal domain-containing protein [Bacteroidota bacterium]
MGVIQRQSIKRSLVSYIGVGVGMISTLFIYPLESTLYGRIQFVLSVALLLSPVFSLGVKSLAVRFYPEFSEQAEHDRGLFRLLLLLTVAIYLIVGGGLYLSQDWWLDVLSISRQSKFYQYADVIWPLALLYSLVDLSTLYTSNYQRITVPEIFTNLFLKLAVPTLILGYHFQYWTSTIALYALWLVYAIILLSLLVYLHQQGQRFVKVDWSFLTAERRKGMLSYALFGVLASLGTHLAFRLDNIMTTEYLGETANGFYNIALFISNTIAIPYNALIAIVSPFISGYWQKNDLANIQDVYRRSSLNLLMAGLFLFGLIFLLLDDIISVSTDSAGMETVRNVIIILGIAKVIDVTAGVNSAIISFSKAYRFNFVVISILGLLNIGLNLWLIPIFQVTGVALATLISLVLFNLIKLVFIYWRFGIHLFTWRLLWAFLLGSGLIFLVNLLPRFADWWWNVPVIGGVFTLVLGGAFVLTGLVPKPHELWEMLRNR